MFTESKFIDSPHIKGHFINLALIHYAMSFPKMPVSTLHPPVTPDWTYFLLIPPQSLHTLLQHEPKGFAANMTKDTVTVLPNL